MKRSQLVHVFSFMIHKARNLAWCAEVGSDQIRCDSVLRLLLHFSILLLFCSSHISLYLIHQITHIKSTPSDAHNYQGPRFFPGEKVNLIIKRKGKGIKIEKRVREPIVSVSVSVSVLHWGGWYTLTPFQLKHPQREREGKFFSK
uniref:Uncharacterized protein n=1 Tax=Opuntia streptacantha TaxID=393608 RepID=A0A7C9CRR4_OPUST